MGNEEHSGPGAGDGPAEGDAAASGTPPPALQPARPSAGGGGGAPTGGNDTASAGAAGGGPQYTQRATWLCVEPSLKAMMDRLEGDGKSVIATLAVRLQSNPNIIARLRDATGLQTLQVNGMNVLGVALNEYDARKFKAQADLEMFRATDAKALEEQIGTVLNAAGTALGLYLGGLQIDVTGANAAGGGPAGGGGTVGEGAVGPRGPARPGGPGGPPSPARPSTGPGTSPGSDSSGGTGDERNTLSLTRRSQYHHAFHQP